MVTTTTKKRRDIKDIKERYREEEFHEIKVTLKRMFMLLEVWTQREYRGIEEIIEKQKTLEILLNNACKH